MSSLPFKVKATFEYTSPHEDDLHFQTGQIITVTEDDEEDWYTGEYVDASGAKQEGIFPRNFVERYEPTAPPRPTRSSRPKRDAEPLAPTIATEPSIDAPTKIESQEQGNGEAREPTLVIETFQPTPSTANTLPPATSQPVEVPVAAVMPAPKPIPSSVKPSGPPPVSGKPTSGSFRDRIAAFNKPAAPPVAPFKPGGFAASGSSFIKKPFVAPPPSKDSYVPIPRESIPQKIYKREEDPEIATWEAENLENAGRAGLAPTNDGDGENQPKPTSLKERIALLQKQQMEQAARHAEAAQKKEKPKRPTKKRTESHTVGEVQEEGEGTVLERQDSYDTVGKKSLDSTREESLAPRGLPRRKSSKGPPTHPGFPRESFDDGNEADMSGAGNETEEPEEISTGRDDSDDKPRTRAPTFQHRAPGVPVHEPDAEEEDGAVEAEQGQEEEGEEDIDPEIRRKEELRARMAKMSGGMGMHGMFGPPGGMPLPGPALPPKKKKSSALTEKAQSSEYFPESASLPSTRAPPVPGIPLTRVRSPEDINKKPEQEDESQQAPITSTQQFHEVPEVEDVKPTRPVSQRSLPPQGSSYDNFSAPPVPGGRPAPPPVPSESRPPLPSPSIPLSPSAGSESDDEMSLRAPQLPIDTPSNEAPIRALPPRPSGTPSMPSRPGEGPGSPRSPTAKRTSYFGVEVSATSPTTPGTNSRRASRVPPIPGQNSVLPATQTRAPPPPPPTMPLSRSSTGDQHTIPSPKHADQEESDEEVTEYEGDYDTDIASAVPHKDALKSHARDSSVDDSSSFRTSLMSPSVAPPPPPPASAPRAMPPPLPSQPPPPSRQSTDVPRTAPPPPPPPTNEQIYDEEGDEYDPYKYTASKVGRQISGILAPGMENDDEDQYSTPPWPQLPPPFERAAPPPPPLASPQLSRATVRQSLDVQRAQASGRRSTDLSRISMDSGFVANDVDLAEGTMWWISSKGTPPVFQNRKDVLYEIEESTSTKRGGKSTTVKEFYVLFQDYSQSIITVRYDPQNPSDANLEQRHEQPPSRLRQDQLEKSHELFGRHIADSVAGKKDTVVGDGTPQALITESLKPLSNALLPVGTRAYGALVYSNLANASTSQNDEIRPGDIITFRNTRFQGKHGPMHAKYSMEVGLGNTGGHVAVVAEWDGTKKKVRAWEQGREKKKVALESFKLDDLRSGEVRIWRVMPRSWVGWEGQN